MKEKYKSHLGIKHQLIRFSFQLFWLILARWLPRSIGSGWKRCLLRLFGAKISPTAVIYSSAKIYYPSNLYMDDYACLASNVDCYNVDVVHIGKFATVSQGAILCTASHDITSVSHDLITSPIIIGNQAWVGASAFIGMGICVGEGAVVGARAAVFKNVEPWSVVGGNPAKFIKKRILENV